MIPNTRIYTDKVGGEGRTCVAWLVDVSVFSPQHRSIMLLRWCVYYVLVLTGSVLASQQGCTEQRTCADCIQTPGCVWCSRFNTTQVGQQRDNKSVEEMTPLLISTTKPQQTTAITSFRYHHRMKLRLRKGVPQNLTINYRLATDYPVDLYYLMDLSKSMEDDKENVAAVGYDLAKLLSTLTTQYRLGFGSFVDKVLMPYSDTSPVKISGSCEGCAAPYAFKNHLSLSDGYQLFKSSVSGAQISGNMDSPEGGFDALMQAMVCDEIGWRQQARKIIIFSTDDKFHYAGDGKLAGIIKPNDEKCHLTDNLYTDYDKYDYPSIAQIDKVAKERQINIIFAVTGHEGLYEKLHELVETSSYGLLNQGSSNVVDLVKDQYQKLSSVVSLSDNSSSELRMEYSVQCEPNGPVLYNTDSCSEVQPGNNISFFLNITVCMYIFS
ncbi:hypothetical protein Pcinc_025612 [Petrolisthes cinctipes]|uniref:Integrin beta n=1 Tax=Petrolisthes cinctipes TaxID=88211 RepID=A0AAE1F862_PETCI|nr:hypothetical protein Pcinc_025612 [Petrolisthes cinctipes]